MKQIFFGVFFGVIAAIVLVLLYTQLSDWIGVAIKKRRKIRNEKQAN